MRAGQFPVLTIAAVSLFSILAKDKGNFLRLEIFNKQPALINDAAIKFKIINAVHFYAKKKRKKKRPLNNTICWPL